MRRKCHVVAAPGHAGGLFNQIESLLGYTYIALTKNATLALPPLAPHVVWPELVPFEDVFEPEPFISAMLQQGLAVVRNASELPACAVTRPDGRRARHIYGAFLRAAPNSSLSWLEDAAYRGLVPVGRLRRRARKFLAQSGLARAEGGFGCLHARIERVSLRVAHRNAGGARRAWSTATTHRARSCRPAGHAVLVRPRPGR